MDARRVLIPFVCALWLGAQGPGRVPVQNLGPAQGLTPTWVLSLAQDHDGLLWAGTDEGLFRGDGEHFARIDESAPPSAIHALWVDARGRVWAAGTRGLGLWDGRELRALGAESGLASEGIYSLGEDAEGALWVLQGGRPLRSPDGRRFEADPSWPEGAPGLGLHVHPGEDRVALRSDGTCWKARPGQPWILLPRLPAGWGPVQVVADGKGWIWVRGDYHLLGLAPGAGAWKEFPVRGMLLRLIRTRDGVVRLAAAGGLSTLEPSGPVPLPPLLNTFLEQGIRACLVDREGGLWIAGNGLYRALGRNRVRIYGMQDGLPSMATWTVARDRQRRLWVATSGGLAVSTEKGWRVIHPERVNALAVAPDGALWVGGGALLGALLRVDPRALRVERVPFPGPKEARFSKGLVFRHGELWAASNEVGLWRLRREGGAWQWRPMPVGGEDGQHGGALCLDADGHVWYGYRKGAAVWDGAAWQTLPGPITGQVQAMALAPGGEVAVAYLDELRVHVYRMAGGTPVRVSERHPLGRVQGLVVYSAAFDAAGGLWLGCNRGLARVKASGHRTWWGAPEGFPGEDCAQGGLFFEGGEAWVSTSAGLIHLDAATEAEPPLEAPMHTQGWVEGRPVPRWMELAARAGSGSLELAFFTPQFSKRARIQWEAWLEGRDREWHPLPGGRIALAGLLPGPQTLHIRGRLEDGRTTPETRVAVRGLPRWWQRPLPQVGLILLGGGLLWGVIALRGRALARRNRHLEAVVGARTRDLERANQRLERMSRAKSEFLAGMSHELRTPMNAVVLYGELIHQKAEDLKDEELKRDILRIQGSGQHLLSVINGILDLSKIEAGKMETRMESVDVGVLFQEVRYAVEPLVMRNGNVLELRIPEGQGPLTTDSTRLRQILINLVGNAAKFTEDGHIRLSMRSEGSLARFEVEDSGAGMSPGQLKRIFQDYEQAEGEDTSRRYGGSGLGLPLSRRLAELLKGELWARSTPGVGSTFILRIPG